MTKVTEKYLAAAGPVVLCDFSPPRGADLSAVDAAAGLAADFICVAYNPGKAVRADSAAVAHQIRERTGRDVVFNLAGRDMNRLALGTHLLGAQLLGLENVLVVQGDIFSSREREHVSAVAAYTATGLIDAIRALNDGLDYRGLKLRAPTDLCVGASIDLGRPLPQEVRLTQRKAAAGAQFFVTQPIFDPTAAERFLDLYRREAGEALSQPVFWGLQVLAPEGLVFGDVPAAMKSDLEKGRDGAEIARELLAAFVAAGIRGVYLVPPILRGGARDYEAAARVLTPPPG